MVIRYYLGVGGVETVINNLCNGLLKIGYNLAIGAYSFYQDPPDNIEKVNLKKFRSLTSNNRSAYDFDIIHNHNPSMNYYSLLTSKPFVFHYHGSSNRIQEMNLKMSMLLCRNRLARVIFVSNSALNHLTNIVGKRVSSKIPSDVIYNGVNTSSYHTNLPRPYVKGHPQLLFVSNLYPHKNVLSIIEAMPEIIKLYPDVHLQIVGDGKDYQRLSHKIREKKLENSIELIGSVSEEDLILRYSSCDIYISASKFETFNLPSVEAMACGKPVLLSDIPPHKELLEASNAGLTFSLLDNSSICKGLNDVYDNRKSFGAAARVFAERNDWSGTCQRIARIYEHILTEN
jgi:glycosyltransferase involved in cell wall biosynthesis